MLCSAVTKKDMRCSNRARPGSRLCGTHQKSKTVALVSDNQLANDSLEEDEATPGVNDLIRAVKDMGLESGSPNMTGGYETPWEYEIMVKFEGTAVMRSGNAKHLVHDGGRCRSEDPELIDLRSPGRVMQKDLPSTQSTPSRPPKPKLRTTDIVPDPHEAFCETPTNDIPPELDERLQWELSRIMVQPPDTKTGIVYICDVQYEPRISSGTRVIKIGVASDINKRLKAHFHSCASSRLRLITSYPRSKLELDTHELIRNLYQVESLIHKTLEEFRYDKKCGCGKNHKELFEIVEHELEYILGTVEHWVSWSERKLGHALIPHGR
ncbi:meiotically up-regulated gene 113-domain-containing protein [Aspergillus pseudotamarii]|uniref:Meiotically up-regulated gene 113-domain-containing protein n=1 Tax=Aspergillus pseudotamarii TaxID=132259 RepID=A0A5N6SPD1_ASPPS|nr:meiotically up-regulated gene 113-domain-containing protein [Aspergillus pseudotamarii]KAE8135581.1 meiotically up-regulated gene 113-domain-containing protein [Aspergillus pseudotamarii]